MISLFSRMLAVAAAGLQLANAISIDVNDTASLQNASATLAYGLMSWYTNNQTGTPTTAVGTLPSPLYWWEAGALWGGLIDYASYTGDDSYNPTIQRALLAQTGPYNNYMPPNYFGQLGNDDQAFWAIACLNAVEYGFPTPPGNSSTLWLDLAEAVFNTMVPRWDTTTCNGGLRWQIFQSNAGYNYKNSISNGGFFQISARLAHHTGNQTYVEWCEKIWDWMEGVGLIDSNYYVFDGTDPTINCTEVDHVVWSYNPSVMLYGATMLYNYTNGSDIWEKRTTGLVTACSNTFFSPYKNSTNVMYEYACEPHNNCNNDQYSFKAYLARWMAQSAIVAPYIANAVTTLLATSAEAAAQSCSGGNTSAICGQKWYVGGFDGSYGPGQQLSALETVQSLLLLKRDTTANHTFPSTEPNVDIELQSPSTTFKLPPRSSATGAASESSSAAKKRSVVANIGVRASSDARCWLIAALPMMAGMLLGGAMVR